MNQDLYRSLRLELWSPEAMALFDWLILDQGYISLPRHRVVARASKALGWDILKTKSAKAEIWNRLCDNGDWKEKVKRMMMGIPLDGRHPCPLS